MLILFLIPYKSLKSVIKLQQIYCLYDPMLISKNEARREISSHFA